MTSRATIRIAATALMALCQMAVGEGAPPAAGLTVSAVKFWSLGNSTRIAIEVSDEFSYRKDRLENPDRMFVDIIGAQPRIEGAAPKGQHVIPVNDKFVKQIRVAEPKSGTTRVVVDLEPGVDCVTSQLSEPNRMMIEVTFPGRPDTPTVTPAVVVIKRFEPPPMIARKMGPAPVIKALDDPPPDVPMRTIPNYTLPAGKRRRLLSSAIAPVTPPPTADPMAKGPVLDGAPLPAKRNAGGDRSLARVFGLKIKRIVIDAGHGGKDEGTRGPGGMTEKDLVLDVAKRVGALLQENLGVEIVYTRSDDTFIPLEKRPEIANEKGGDLFISIHANASTLRTVSGVEIYYLSFSNSRVDLETASRENAGADSSVHQLQTLLQKTMLNDKLKESSEFASKVLLSMAGPPAAAAPGKTSRSRGVKRAPFIVLIGAHMPSILCEIGFITNTAEEARMAKPAQRQKIADALAQGVEDYAQSFSRFQVAAKPARTAAARPSAGQ